ncbi:alpha/beta family hydrolase [Sporichthya sp.]|uniref:alpha/beta hydrolase family protein n=1 Tax=Sporichthya sp. TaxID=65475 RepID=UPI0017E64E5A|nr:hydrolase [Sporichthya sp.]
MFAVSKGKPKRTLVLGHGAGGGTGARDLQALAQALPARGTSVVLVEQPWRLAGRKVAGPPPTLDVAWIAVLEELRRAPQFTGLLSPSLIVGGRSAGARVACRTATTVGAVACLALSFPLHPPGRPERSRVDELLGTGVPTLVVQGERDSFGGPPEFPPGTEIAEVPGADHGFKVPARAELGQAGALALITDAVMEWISAL